MEYHNQIVIEVTLMNTNKALSKYTAGLTLATVLLLLIPLIAMQFTEEVNWKLFDFIFMGTMIFGTGFTYKLITGKSGKTTYRIALGLALAAGFILIWVNGAVGIIGNEGNPANLMYIGVLAVGFIGSFIARFESKGMSNTLYIMALAQTLVPVIALIIWPPQAVSWGAAGVVGVFTLNAFFIMLFITSAMIFRYTANEESQHESG